MKLEGIASNYAYIWSWLTTRIFAQAEWSTFESEVVSANHSSNIVLKALEYFIVRHVATVAMYPMLEGHFTIGELLNLTFRWARLSKMMASIQSVAYIWNESGIK